MGNKIIKKLVLKNEEEQNEIVLDFDNGVNIIIGSKGGGKSTLLNILHCMHHNLTPDKKVIEALNENGLSIQYLEYSNSEKIYFKNLQKNTNETFGDIIKQDDKIKTSLNEINEVKGDIDNFIENLIKKNAKNIVDIFEAYLDTHKNMIILNQNNEINWSLISFFTLDDEKLTVLKNKLINQIENNTKSDSNEMNMYALLALYQKMLKIHHPDIYSEHKDVFNKLSQFHYDLLQKDIIKNKTNDIFIQLLNDESNKLRQSSDIATNLTNFKNQTKNYVHQLAVLFAKNAALFKYINDPNLKINFKRTENTKYNMQLTIDRKIRLRDFADDEDFDSSLFNKIINTFLYKPKSKINSWNYWIKENLIEKSKIKPKETEILAVIKKTLRNTIEKEIILLAEDKDYNKMSLGTRTSYGIRQKINNFKDSILFLDQPEDNLDNYTIYHDLIKIFNKDKQIFMVTHNSNFGTLTNPTTITTCSLNINNINNSYLQRNNLLDQISIPSEEGVTDSPVRHYLEGGNNSLNERYEKLNKVGKGEK